MQGGGRAVPGAVNSLAQIVDRAQTAAAQMGAGLGWALAAFGVLYLAWRLALRLQVRKALRTVEFTPDELQARREADGDIIIVDVRSPLAVKERPLRISGALHADAHELAGLSDGWPHDRLTERGLQRPGGAGVAGSRQEERLGAEGRARRMAPCGLPDGARRRPHAVDGTTRSASSP